jgi:hypothetical protein
MQRTQPRDVAGIVSDGAQELVADLLDEQGRRGWRLIVRHAGRRARGEHRRDRVAVATGDPDREALQLTLADGVDDACVRDRGNEQVVEACDRVRDAARAVGDLRECGERAEALAIASEARPPRRRDGCQDRATRDDEHPLQVWRCSEVFAPHRAGEDQHDRDDADDRNVARPAVQRTEQREQDADRDENVRR